MKVVCSQCGKTFSKSRSQVKKYHNHFCKRRCYTLFRRANPCYTRKKDDSLNGNNNLQRKLKEYAKIYTGIHKQRY